MKLPPIKHRGSVKNIRGEANQGELIFEYTDSYSVFDWGVMPDALAGKGKALAFMASAFFSLLEVKNSWNELPGGNSSVDLALARLRERGLNHHGVRLVDENGGPLDLGSAQNFYKVKRVEVIRPDQRRENGVLVWDYKAYGARPVQALVPLEVIFRFGIPAGSSFLERAKDKSYKEGDIFEKPIIEYSTKLETSDRYLSYGDAQKMAHLTDEEFAYLQSLSHAVALKLKQIFQSLDITLWDGKLEFAFIPGDSPKQRDFMLVDSIGPDELRLTYRGVQLSKQTLRNFYRGGPWHKATAVAKKLAEERGVADWKKICLEELKESPPSLDEATKGHGEMIYQSLAKEIGKKYFSLDIFPQAPGIASLVQ